MARKRKNEAITESTTANETYVAPKLVKEDAVSDYPEVELDPKTTLVFHHPIHGVKIEPEKPAEEWIWVEGYKGTHKDLTAYGNFQFEMNKVYEMPEDASIKACDNGFHFCLKLNDVFGYYDVGKSNRFFKVRGLVRKSDYESYGKIDLLHWYRPQSNVDKLAAKSIEILWELSPDEILAAYNVDLIKDWTYEEKLLALETNPKAVDDEHKAIELAKLGYSIPFAKLVVEANKYDVAKKAASMDGLSMDMKVYLIMKGMSEFDSISRSLKRMANAVYGVYGTTARADAMSAQLDAYRALMNSGVQNANGLRAEVVNIDEMHTVKPLGFPKGE